MSYDHENISENADEAEEIKREKFAEAEQLMYSVTE